MAFIGFGEHIARILTESLVSLAARVGNGIVGIGCRKSTAAAAAVTAVNPRRRRFGTQFCGGGAQFPQSPSDQGSGDRRIVVKKEREQAHKNIGENEWHNVWIPAAAKASTAF